MTRASLCVTLAALCVIAPARADDAEAKKLAEQACWMCHEPRMLEQQRLTKAQWDKTLAKMGKWGPALQDGQEAQLSSYLSGPTGPAAVASASTTPPATITVAEIEARYAPQPGADRGDPKHGGEVYAKACAMCHGPDAKGALAPSLIGRAVITRPKDWAEVIKKGRRRMPSMDVAVNATDITDMLAWVRKTSREQVQPALPK